MTSTADPFAQAQHHHQQGELSQAERLYRSILRIDPNHADALHFLGLIAHQTGHAKPAISLMKQAIDLHPHSGVFHSNLGVVLQSVGRSEEALDCFTEALRLDPTLQDAHANRGNLLLDRHLHDEAIACFRQALRLNPSHSTAHFNLANALRDQGAVEQAIESYRRALEINSRHVDALNNLGVLLKDQGKIEEAQRCYRAALSLDPRYGIAHRNLGNILKNQGRFEEAIGAYEQALRIDPDDVDTLANLGLTLRDQGDLDAAFRILRQAEQLDPEHTAVWNNLGLAFMDQGTLDEAERCFENALRRRPADALAHFNRASLWLLQGAYEKGWPEYEFRWRRADSKPRDFTQPRWDGSSLPGKTILIHTEQGLGDILQFIRYVPLVKQRVGSVLVQCPAIFMQLLRCIPEIDRLVADGEPIPEFDVQVPLLSLPCLFQTTLESIPARVPYLHADVDRTEFWRRELAAHVGFRIGIVWQGSQVNHLRAIGAAPLAALSAIPGVRLFSLQMGHAIEQLAHLPEGSRIMELGSRFDSTSLQDSAAVLANLDLLVTIDTAIAHLAGAMGIRVWTLLPFAADWRWLLDRNDSPWYPSMRLFRQGKSRDWAEVIRRVASELPALVAESSSKPV